MLWKRLGGTLERVMKRGHRDTLQVWLFSPLSDVTIADSLVERGHDIGERKHESTITIMSQPSEDCRLTDYSLELKLIRSVNNYMDVVESYGLPVPPYDVERLNTAAIMFRAFGRDEALKRMTALKYEDYKPIIVSLTAQLNNQADP
jgi:hypothetical protein